MDGNLESVVRAWFAEMGYPRSLDERTDWRTVGRTAASHWRRRMSELMPRRRIAEAEANAALSRLVGHFRRRDSSTAVVPPQVRLPRERRDLRASLDAANARLARDALAARRRLEERSGRCVELRDVNGDIVALDRRIHAAKMALEGVRRRAKEYRENARRIEVQLNNHSDSAVFNSNCEWSMERISSIPPAKTYDLVQSILEYNKCIPSILDAKLLKYQKDAHTKFNLNSNQNISLDDGLTSLYVFHCRLVTATIQMKKECIHAKMASAIAKSKIIERISSDSSKLDMFTNEYNQICSQAYDDAFESEMRYLRNHSGIYREIYEKFAFSGNIKCVFDNIIETKRKIKDMQNKTLDKIQHAKAIIDECVEVNQNISNTLIQKKNIRVDRVLWYPNFKSLQDGYLKVILKNPNMLKLDPENPFSSFGYLLILLNEICVDQKLEHCNKILVKENEWWRNILEMDKNEFLRLQNKTSDEQYGNNSYYDCQKILLFIKNTLFHLQPLKNVLSMLKKEMWLKSELESIYGVPKVNFSNIRNILGIYLTENLQDLEKHSTNDFKRFHRNYLNMSKLDTVIIDFMETYQFFNEFLNKNNVALSYH